MISPGFGNLFDWLIKGCCLSSFGILLSASLDLSYAFSISFVSFVGIILLFPVCDYEVYPFCSSCLFESG